MMDYRNCRICPRYCSVDRTVGEKGICGQRDHMVLSTAALHFGEEPPISGEGGSGTLFFSGCSLRCPFCQNWQVSRGTAGAEISVNDLCLIMLEMQKNGAENINFVTGTHFIPSIKEAVISAKTKGLNIPFLWNCSGYETLEAVEELNSFIDIYLPDYKTTDSSLAEKLYGVSDYPDIAEKAIKKMIESRPLSFTKNMIMKSGVIVRHLVIPGEIESSRKVLKWYSDNFQERALISLMVQYTPVEIPGNTRKIPVRSVSKSEYSQLMDYLTEYKIEDGFIQDLEIGSDWLPDFTRKRPFPSNQTKVIWSSISL